MEALVKQFGRKAHEFICTEPEYEARYNLLEGSVRSSKTFALDAKILVKLNGYKVPPNAKRLLTGATKQTLYRNVLIDLFTILGQDMYNYNMSTGELWIDGVQWFCMGAKDEASYKQILGSTVGVCVSDEVVEYPQSFLSVLWTRMSPDNARWYGSTNPGNPYSYLKADCIDNEQFNKRMRVHHFTLRDNPNISMDAKEAIIASQSGVFKLRYIDGLWVVAEGSIYRDSWKPEENCYAVEERLSDDKRFTLRSRPIGLRNTGGHIDHWFSVDAGVDHPQVYGEFFDDGERVWLDRVWRWDSRKQMRQKTDEEYADDLVAFMGLDGKAGLACQVIVPPEAASFRAALVQRGLFVTDAENEVVEGIHTVSTLLAQRRLLINVDQCEGIEKRIPNYAWDDKAAKRGEEKPLKVQDDDVDMLRYGLHIKIPTWRFSGIPPIQQRGRR